MGGRRGDRSAAAFGRWRGRGGGMATPQAPFLGSGLLSLESPPPLSSRRARPRGSSIVTLRATSGTASAAKKAIALACGDGAQPLPPMPTRLLFWCLGPGLGLGWRSPRSSASALAFSFANAAPKD